MNIVKVMKELGKEAADNEHNEVLIPSVAVITDVRTDTPDVKTFRVLTPDGKKPFEHMPGQCAMLSIPGVGEAHVFYNLLADKHGIYGILH